MSGNPQENSVVKLSARELAEFLLRSGSIDSRHGGVMRAQEGARIHRRLQAACKKQEGSDYQSEVYLKGERKLDGLCYLIDGRADGIFTSPDGIRTIDEIKTVEGEVLQDSCPEHWAQARIYAALLCELEGLSQVRVQLTYFRIDLQLDSADWKIYSRSEAHPPHYIDEHAEIAESIVTEGCEIDGKLWYSVLFSNVTVEEGAELNSAVVMSNTVIKKGASVKYAIIAEDAIIEEGAIVGDDPCNYPDASEWGIAVVGRGAIIKKGQVVRPKEMIEPDANR